MKVIKEESDFDSVSHLPSRNSVREGAANGDEGSQVRGSTSRWKGEKRGRGRGRREREKRWRERGKEKERGRHRGRERERKGGQRDPFFLYLLSFGQ